MPSKSLVALAAVLPVCLLANPVDVPFATDFSTEFADFFAPTGDGYNWGHDWRTENYQSWVTASNRTVTASMQARTLEGKDFFIKTTVDPVELEGSGHTIGLAACGSNRTFGACYLADVRPDADTFRILRVSGGNVAVAAEQAIGLPISDMEPFDLELSGDFTGSSVFLRFTVRRGAESRTIAGTDTSALTGTYFGLQGRTNGSGRFENHFDDYELRPLEVVQFLPDSLDHFAPVDMFFAFVGGGFQPKNGIPPWTGILPSGGFEGIPSAADVGQYQVSYTAVAGDHSVDFDVRVTVPAPTDAIVSEFMADNDDTLLDEDGESSDWIELFNPTASPVDLTDWHLTDDPAVMDKWAIPAGTVLPAFGFRVIFASNKPRPDHANFRLDADGGYLALARPNGTLASEFASYPEQFEDIAFGVYGDYVMLGYLLEATPAAPNAIAGYSGFVADTTFSVRRGFFDAPFSVDVACATPGATIVHTTDGSAPTLSNGTASASPATVAIHGTTVLRAAAFADGLVPANVDTQTYLFLDDIKLQDSAHAQSLGWPSGSVNGQVFSYGMDPEIVNPLSGEEFETAMTDIPTVSMVTDIGNFVDPDFGFWVNAENRGSGWERPVSLELIHPDGAPGFQIDAGVRLRGGFSRQGSNPKHAFHLYFRSEYGDGKLNHALFGDEGVSTYDAFDLRATQGRSWHWSHSADATFNRDVFGRESQRDMGQPYSRSRHYHVYVNGQYFGLFQSQERVDKFYAASHFGGEPDDYDVIKTRTRPHRVEALDGDPEAWSRLFDAAVAGFAGDAAYHAVQGRDANGDPDPAGENLVDIDNLIDYMLVIFYTGQSDGPVNLGANVPKNFFALRPRDGRFGFRFFVHDNEDAFQSVTRDSTVPNSTGDRLTYFNPKWLHQQLMQNPGYVRRFQDRVHRHFFNGGAFTTAACQARFQATADRIANAVVGESARWGDFRRANPYRQSDWQNAVNGKVSSWIPQRGSIVVDQLRNRGLYPDVDAPVFSQHGGQVAPGFRLAIDAPAGDIHFTLDGADPSEPGAQILEGGATTETLIAREAMDWKYLVTRSALGNSDVVVGHPSYDESEWKHPMFDDSAWAVGQAPLGFGGVGAPNWNTFIDDGGNPHVPTVYLRRQFDIAGASSYSDLSVNIRRDDGAMAYLNGREVARSNLPNGTVSYATLASTPAAGAEETEFFPTAFDLDSGDLVEGSNTLAVEVHQNTTGSNDLVIDVELLGTNVSGGIPILESTTVKARAFANGEWSALTEATFFTTSPASPANLVISEIFYNPGGVSEDTEYLELLNVSPSDTIHLDGLRFADGVVFEIPPGTVLAPGERLLIVKNRTAFEAAFGEGLPVVGEYSGSLRNSGEHLRLDGIVAFEYRDSAAWPALADGEGRSLVFLGGDPALGENWRSSAGDGGSPGGADAASFAGGDLAAYAFGGFTVAVLPDGRMAFPRNLAADDVEYLLESSRDLETWSAAKDWQLVDESALEGAFAAQIMERNPALGDDGYVRVRARLRN